MEVPINEEINQIQSTTEQQHPLVCSERIEMPKFQPALVKTPDHLFRKFSLLRGETHLMEKYYNKHIEQHTISDGIKKIFIPVHPIDVLKKQVMLENVRVKAIRHLRKDTKTKTSAIFLVDQNLRASIALLVFFM